MKGKYFEIGFLTNLDPLDRVLHLFPHRGTDVSSKNHVWVGSPPGLYSGRDPCVQLLRFQAKYKGGEAGQDERGQERDP